MREGGEATSPLTISLAPDLTVTAKARMTKNPSKIKRCPECRRLVEAETMRPLSRTRLGGGVRFACPACFTRVMGLRKAVAARR